MSVKSASNQGENYYHNQHATQSKYSGAQYIGPTSVLVLDDEIDDQCCGCFTRIAQLIAKFFESLFSNDRPQASPHTQEQLSLAKALAESNRRNRENEYYIGFDGKKVNI